MVKHKRRREKSSHKVVKKNLPDAAHHLNSPEEPTVLESNLFTGNDKELGTSERPIILDDDSDNGNLEETQKVHNAAGRVLKDDEKKTLKAIEEEKNGSVAKQETDILKNKLYQERFVEQQGNSDNNGDIILLGTVEKTKIPPSNAVENSIREEREGLSRNDLHKYEPRSVSDIEPQPGPSGIRKRKIAKPSPSCDSSERPKLPFIDDELIDYLTLEERRVLYTACQVVPTVDPSFVYDLITKQSLDNAEAVVEYLFGHVYPTIKERVRREYMEKRRKAYLGEDGEAFSIAEYLTIYPDPEIFFERERQTNENYNKHAMAFLSRHFHRYDIEFLRKLLNYHKGLLLPTYRVLSKHAEGIAKGLKKLSHVTKAKIPVKFKPLYDNTPAPEYPDIIDDVFFREVQYCLHENEIKDYKIAYAAKREKALQLAEQKGLLKECYICCEDRYLEEDMIKCSKGIHEFCKNCVKQHAHAQIGEGMSWIRCMDDSCQVGRFEIATLQGIVAPGTFQLLVRRSQEEKLRDSNRGDIESCPFCEFATVIENKEDRIFRCLNPICQKESCRNCREESHVPLRCEEVEKDFETRKRKFIEESMSEAVIRKCPTCSKRITKEDGCNKMTCPCGTFFCYVCNAKLPKKDPYQHYDKRKNAICEQNTSLEDLHQMVARQAGQEALRLFNEQHPETIGSRTPDIDELSGFKGLKKTRSSERRQQHQQFMLPFFMHFEGLRNLYRAPPFTFLPMFFPAPAVLRQEEPGQGQNMGNTRGGNR